MKRYLTKQIWIPVLMAVIIAQTIGLALLWNALLSDRQKLDDQTIKETADTVALTNAATMSGVVVSLSDNAVYMPDLHLKLPLTNDSQQLLYSTRSVGLSGKQQTTDVNTRANAPFSPGKLQRLACTPVRLAFEPKPNPYNPHETVRASVQLADSRTLQAYSSQTNQCSVQYNATATDPIKLATLFKQAQSY